MSPEPGTIRGPPPPLHSGGPAPIRPDRGSVQRRTERPRTARAQTGTVCPCRDCTCALQPKPVVANHAIYSPLALGRACEAHARPTESGHWRKAPHGPAKRAMALGAVQCWSWPRSARNPLCLLGEDDSDACAGPATAGRTPAAGTASRPRWTAPAPPRRRCAAGSRPRPAACGAAVVFRQELPCSAAAGRSPAFLE